MTGTMGKMSMAPGTMGTMGSMRGTGWGGDTTNPPPPMDDDNDAWNSIIVWGLGNCFFLLCFYLLLTNNFLFVFMLYLCYPQSRHPT
ncbi:hypothetical protein L208DRAFT_33422 [Tricholoma matsutake]|nr:hypothetical protein L208DRAFT_33422 [Tricholoma matsutake 945]